MKHKVLKKIISALLAFVMIVGFLPASVLTVYAGHTCPECQEWIDGSPYCSECYACDECVEMCYQCGKCTGCTGSDICDGCTSEEGSNMCIDCAEEKGAHCPNCETCYYVVQSWCEECGFCEDCNDICDDCSVNLGFGLLCWDCAADKDSHCPGCGGCYFAEGLWCEECNLCVNCSEHDQECSAQFGAILCKECAAERGNHCPECEQCYFDVGSWCEECGKCEDCSPACLYCCEEEGTIICEECAIESGMHCTECSECYGGGEFCTECGVCTACADICATDEMCIDCAIANGYHCPSCEECCDQAILCESCGEKCNECADAFCESCNLCSECVQICQGCGSCEECATICPNCEEYCSECEGICDDCEYCLVCCADLAAIAGCDCAGWVCVESNDWQVHFDETHTESDGSHSARPSAVWSFDGNYHWHGCTYCDDAGHYTGKAAHSYDATGKCTTCYYVKNAKIQIVVQPKDVKYVCVTSAEEAYDESNIAHFSVKAIGNSALTYTWCRRMYVDGQLTYVPLRNPGQGECYDGPNLAILAPTDACCTEYTYACIITDEEGNETRTVDVVLTARHDYQYYKEWRTHQRPYESAERNKYGHILKCVGETCEKVTHLLPHEDEDRNGYCDICDYEIGKILITKQPKDVKNVYSYNPDEGYDESNIAHFSVEAKGESKLTYTWCRKQYVGGVLKYVPLKNPQAGEKYDGPELALQVPEDACCTEYTYACIITDEEGNETRTVDVVLTARHNYQYYKDYLTTRSNPYAAARRRYTSHVLVCVSPGCGKVTRYRQHEDADHDYFCDICNSQKDIMYVGITVTAPKEGQMPDYTVVSDSPAYFAMGSASYPGTCRVWMVSDDGETGWEPVDPTYPFAEGKYYKFYIEMHTAEGYEFPPMVSYGGDPYIWAKVNGNCAKAHAVSGMDPLHHISVEYNFGACGDSGADELRIIENIVLEGVTAPVAGEYPSYNCTISGVGYTRNTAYDNGTYAINGICWYDLTYDMWMRPDRPFRVGHQYKVFIDVKTEDGYWFYTSGTKYKPIGSGYINGYSAVLGIQSDARFEQSLSVVFTCQPKTVKAIAVSGIEEPKDGCAPDFTAVTDSEFYTVESIDWYDYENNMDEMTDTDTFVEGNEYWVRITVVPNQDEGINMCKFVQDKTTATLNGVEVKKVKNNAWQEVESTPKFVRIYYTFKSNHAGAHTPSSTWNSDGTYHWKECTVVGCGVVIDGSKAEHSSTGANVATCRHKAVCDVCNAEYGELAAHNPASGWTSDASGHWHACRTAGCTEKCDFASHTPDHTGHATEEYAIKCTECGYVIEAQLSHVHVFDKEVVDEQYKATDATCLKPATFYKSCACGEKGTETFENGRVIDHTEGTEWKSDKDNHWHTCTVAGCGAVIETSKTAHTPNREAATETDAVKCSVCGYVITPALGHTHDVDTTKFESDETNHWNTCSGCSEKQNVSAHEFEWKIDKDATATEKGSKHEECKVCGYKKAAVEIPATGTPTDPTPENPDSPQTGDNSMMGLWIALLFVSGVGVVTTAVYGKKRKSVK